MKSMLELCDDLPRREFAAQDIVVAEGQTTGALFILEGGRVEVLKGDVPVNRVGDPGAVFGEVSVLLNQPAMATVRCLTPCRFRVAADARQFLAAHPSASWHLARMLAHRLNGLTHYLVDLKEQFADREDHLGMVDEVLDSLLHHQAGARASASSRAPTRSPADDPDSMAG